MSQESHLSRQSVLLGISTDLERFLWNKRPLSKKRRSAEASIEPLRGKNYDVDIHSTILTDSKAITQKKLDEYDLTFPGGMSSEMMDTVDMWHKYKQYKSTYESYLGASTVGEPVPSIPRRPNINPSELSMPSTFQCNMKLKSLFDTFYQFDLCTDALLADESCPLAILPNIGLAFPNSARFPEIEFTWLIVRPWMRLQYQELKKFKPHKLPYSFSGPSGMGKSYFLHYAAARLVKDSIVGFTNEDRLAYLDYLDSMPFFAPKGEKAVKRSFQPRKLQTEACLYIQNAAALLDDQWRILVFHALLVALRHRLDVVEALLSLSPFPEEDKNALVSAFEIVKNFGIKLFVVVDQVNSIAVKKLKTTDDTLILIAAAVRKFFLSVGSQCVMIHGASNSFAKFELSLPESADYMSSKVFYFSDIELFIYLHAMLPRVSLKEFYKVKRLTKGYPEHVARYLKIEIIKENDNLKNLPYVLSGEPSYMRNYADTYVESVFNFTFDAINNIPAEYPNHIDDYLRNVFNALLGLPSSGDHFDHRFMYKLEKQLKFLTTVEESAFIEKFYDYLQGQLAKSKESAIDIIFRLTKYRSSMGRALVGNLLELLVLDEFQTSTLPSFRIQRISGTGTLGRLKLSNIRFEKVYLYKMTLSENTFMGNDAVMVIPKIQNLPLDDLLLLFKHNEEHILLKIQITCEKISKHVSANAKKVVKALSSKSIKRSKSPTYCYLNSLRCALDAAKIRPKIYDVYISPEHRVTEYQATQITSLNIISLADPWGLFKTLGQWIDRLDRASLNKPSA